MPRFKPALPLLEGTMPAGRLSSQTCCCAIAQAHRCSCRVLSSSWCSVHCSQLRRDGLRWSLVNYSCRWRRSRLFSRCSGRRDRRQRGGCGAHCCGLLCRRTTDCYEPHCWSILPLKVQIIVESVLHVAPVWLHNSADVCTQRDSSWAFCGRARQLDSTIEPERLVLMG